jgi:hypothetical protein
MSVQNVSKCMQHDVKMARQSTSGVAVMAHCNMFQIPEVEEIKSTFTTS